MVRQNEEKLRNSLGLRNSGAAGLHLKFNETKQYSNKKKRVNETRSNAVQTVVDRNQHLLFRWQAKGAGHACAQPCDGQGAAPERDPLGSGAESPFKGHLGRENWHVLVPPPTLQMLDPFPVFVYLWLFLCCK